MILIHKYTYQTRIRLKALGGRWDSNREGWEMPDEHTYYQGLILCLEEELKYFEAEERDPDLEGGDLDYVQRQIMSLYTRIKKLKLEHGI